MARTPEEKKKAQAAAYRKWRDSPKGQAYREKKKQREAGITPEPVNDQTR